MAPMTPVRRGLAPTMTNSPLAQVSGNMREASRPEGKGSNAANKKAFGTLKDMGDSLTAATAVKGVELAKDWDADQSMARRKSSHSTRGDRYIANREYKSSGESLLDNAGGDSLVSGGHPSSSSACSNTSVDQVAANIAAANALPTDVDSSAADISSALSVDGNASVNGGVGQRILSFSAMAPPASTAPDARAKYAAARAKALPTSLTAGGKRKIQHYPAKTLDAPGVPPDFYLNTLSWSCDNVLAVALGPAVHIWNGTTGEVATLLDLEESSERLGGGMEACVRSLSWSLDGRLLSVGTDTGFVQIWDVEKQERARTLKPAGGADAVEANASAWAIDGTLSVGFFSGLIRESDTRIKEHTIRELGNAHTSSVCGMAWRGDGNLLASGGNDNVVAVWDRRASVPRMRKTSHNAAVKALAWCPWNDSILATGGGTADRAIHFWNVSSGSRTQSIQTEHQVVGLHWSQSYREIVSVHGEATGVSGYERAGAISVWAHPGGANITTIEAPHEGKPARCSAQSPDGQTVATLGSDDNLKMWTMFETSDEEAKAAKRRAQNASGSAAAEARSAASHTSRALR